MSRGDSRFPPLEGNGENGTKKKKKKKKKDSTQTITQFHTSIQRVFNK